MPWVQRARVVTSALIGGSGRAPREPLALASKRTSVRPSLGLRFPSQKRIVGCVSKVDRPRPCKQRPLAGSIPVTSTGVYIALWEARTHRRGYTWGTLREAQCV